MPELPEVETIRQDLEKIILYREIKKITINKPKLIQGGFNDVDFKKILISNSITSLNRRGKLLILTLKNQNLFLLIHLKMTGQLIFQNEHELIAGGHDDGKKIVLPNKHTHIICTFTDNSSLFFNDQRQFGYMKIVDDVELNNITAQFGIEPLQANFTWDNFKLVFKNKKTVLKAVLLNQTLIAGLGNIYADEVCFASGVLPNRYVNDLTENEKQALFKNCNLVLATAIANRGTTFNTFVDVNGKIGNFSNMLKVFGQQGKICTRCLQGTIIKTKLVGRGTYFCPKCQF